VTRKKLWYLIDVWRQRVDYPALKASVQTLAKKWNARRVLVEDTGAGTSLVQELRGRVPGIIAVKPDGDKASRMAVASAQAKSCCPSGRRGCPISKPNYSSSPAADTTTNAIRLAKRSSTKTIHG
jgi:Terminase RNaseH-like domain